MIQKVATFNEVLKTIRKITQAMDLYSKKLGRTAGVTGPQLLLLKEIQLCKSITTSKLADIVCMSQSTATTIIDKLEEKELVVRTRNNFDKRQWHIDLSSRGLSIIEKLPFSLPEKFISSFSDLPDWRQTQILATLQHVADMLIE